MTTPTDEPTDADGLDESELAPPARDDVDESLSTEPPEPLSATMSSLVEDLREELGGPA